MDDLFKDLVFLGGTPLDSINDHSPRWPPTSEEFTLEINIEVERLRLKILLSKPPPPPQYDLSPRRSPAVGTGLDEPECRIL